MLSNSDDAENYCALCEEGFGRGNKPVRLLGVGVRIQPQSNPVSAETDADQLQLSLTGQLIQKQHEQISTATGAQIKVHYSRGGTAAEGRASSTLEIERPKVTQSVAEAAALGDRSENAEYIYGKKRLREIDSRVRYLSKRLEEISVVSTSLTISTKSILAPGLLWKMTAANSFAIALLARMKSILNAATSALIPRWGKPFWASPPRVTSQSQRLPERLATSSRAFRTRISQHEACLSACYSARAGVSADDSTGDADRR